MAEVTVDLVQLATPTDDGQGIKIVLPAPVGRLSGDMIVPTSRTLPVHDELQVESSDGWLTLFSYGVQALGHEIDGEYQEGTWEDQAAVGQFADFEIGERFNAANLRLRLVTSDVDKPTYVSDQHCFVGPTYAKFVEWPYGLVDWPPGERPVVGEIFELERYDRLYWSNPDLRSPQAYWRGPGLPLPPSNYRPTWTRFYDPGFQLLFTYEQGSQPVPIPTVSLADLEPPKPLTGDMDGQAIHFRRPRIR